MKLRVTFHPSASDEKPSVNEVTYTAEHAKKTFIDVFKKELGRDFVFPCKLVSPIGYAIVELID